MNFPPAVSSSLSLHDVDQFLDRLSKSPREAQQSTAFSSLLVCVAACGCGCVCVHSHGSPLSCVARCRALPQI